MNGSSRAQFHGVGVRRLSGLTQKKKGLGSLAAQASRHRGSLAAQASRHRGSLAAQASRRLDSLLRSIVQHGLAAAPLACSLLRSIAWCVELHVGHGMAGCRMAMRLNHGTLRGAASVLCLRHRVDCGVSACCALPSAPRRLRCFCLLCFAFGTASIAVGSLRSHFSVTLRIQ